MEVTGNPGRGALVVSLVLAAGAALGLLVLVKDKLDDRGEMVPVTGFGGLYLRARGSLTGGAIKTTETSMLDARGAFVLVLALVPVLAAVGALLVYRQRREHGLSVYWPLTIAMIVMALPVLMGNSFAMPAMVAMAIAGFQVRRTEVPRRADRADAEDEADEDDAEYDEEDEYDDEEYEDDEYEDDDEEADEAADEGAEGDEEPDPLAELEEELAEEDAADRGRKK